MNRVKLIRYPNGKFSLYINGLLVKEDFTGTSYDTVMAEVLEFIADTTDTGGNRYFSGNLQDIFDLSQTYIIEDATPTAAEFISTPSLIEYKDFSGAL